MCRSNQKDGRGSEHVDFPSMLLRAYDMWSCDQGEQNQRKQRNWTSTESWIGGGKKKKNRTDESEFSTDATSELDVVYQGGSGGGFELCAVQVRPT